MEKLKRRHTETEKALKSLEEILDEPYSKIVRDATIQRFEFTFEVLWKYLKEYLSFYEGIKCNSPKSCFREALGVGLLDEKQTRIFLGMTDDRNLTSHTYSEKIADDLYHRIKEYVVLMKELFMKMQKQSGDYL